MANRATGRNRVQQIPFLSPQQLAAVPMLAIGSTDAEVGERLGIDRTTVFCWRRYSPTFQAELNQQRAEQARLMGDKLRAAAFQALDTIIELAKSGDGSTRLKAAIAILDRCASACGPTDPAEIVALEEKRRREMLLDSDDNYDAVMEDRDTVEVARKKILKELEESAHSAPGGEEGEPKWLALKEHPSETASVA